MQLIRHLCRGFIGVVGTELRGRGEDEYVSHPFINGIQNQRVL